MSIFFGFLECCAFCRPSSPLNSSMAKHPMLRAKSKDRNEIEEFKRSNPKNKKYYD
jgi:hypothetical protein